MSWLSFETIGLIVSLVFLLLGGGVIPNPTLRTKVLFIALIGGMLGLSILSIYRCDDGPFEVFVKSIRDGGACGGAVTFSGVITTGGVAAAGLIGAWLIGVGLKIARRMGGFANRLAYDYAFA